ncbi:MAG: ABC transporter ATP-binding protein, partial [Candidatus Thorarchaeota archaeon]
MTIKDDIIIKTKGLTKEYPFGEATIKAINGIDFEIKRGEYATIVGPSGSGKTTFLNLIGTIDNPTSGEIFFNGINIREMPAKDVRELRRTKIGFVFQAFNLLEILTTAENIALPMIINGTPAREREDRVQELLNIIGLPDRGDHFPMELSGGQRQRVAIARS